MVRYAYTISHREPSLVDSFPTISANPAYLRYTLETANPNPNKTLPDRFIVLEMKNGSRFVSIKDGQAQLLVVTKGICSEHHLPPNSSYRLAIGISRFGNYDEGHRDGGAGRIKSTVIDDHPTNQKAVLEAILRTLERKFYLEGFKVIIFASSDKYAVDGMLGGYSTWNDQDWIIPGTVGQERPNRKYWARIKQLAEEHETAGCKIGMWEVRKEYIARFL